jgi:hypothetical protein
MTRINSIIYYTERRKQNKKLREWFDNEKEIIMLIKDEALFELKQKRWK